MGKAALRSIAVGGFALLAACAHRPLSFEGGTRWTLPLLTPLDGGALVVPFTVDGKGPYAFVLDPFAPTSAIDRGVAEDLGLYSRNRYQRVLTQRDSTVPVRWFEVLAMASGDLHVRNVDMLGVRPGSLRYGGRTVDGIIGADLLSNSLVVDVDRDAGVVRLAVADPRAAPVPGAEGVRATTYVGGNLVVPVLLDGHTVRLALRFAAPRTAVWPALLRGLAPAAAATREAVVDDTGTAAPLDVAHVARTVRFDDVTLTDLPIATFADQRYRYPVYDGVLGEDVLARYHVVVDKHRGDLALAPRDRDVAARRRARLLRWGDTFAACADDGCAGLQVAHAVLTVTADPAARAERYRVVLEALDAAGRPVGAPLVPVTVGRAPARVVLVGALAPAVRFRVVDAAPAAPRVAQASR